MGTEGGGHGQQAEPAEILRKALARSAAGAGDSLCQALRPLILSCRFLCYIGTSTPSSPNATASLTCLTADCELLSLPLVSSHTCQAAAHSKGVSPDRATFPKERSGAPSCPQRKPCPQPV